MAHPYASQSASSVSRRMKAIGGKGASAGKAWGSTAMASKTGNSYPGKNAGSQVPYFAEGGSVGSRPDRMAKGGKKGKKKGHTTNVVVNIPPSGGPPIGAAPGMPPGPPPPPIPIQIPRAAPPVAPGPMPVPGPGPMPMAGPPRPPMPVGPPGLPPGVRPPGMKAGGKVGRYAGGGKIKALPKPPSLPILEAPDFVRDMERDIGALNRVKRPRDDDMKAGGTVKRMADGGIMDSNEPLGQGGPEKITGWNTLKKGGAVRAQLGMAVPPVPVRRPVVPPAAAAASPAAKVVGLARRGAAANKAAVQRQAVRDVRDAGPRSFKDGGAARKAKGGKVHDDEAQDRKLIAQELKKEERKERMASGGSIKQGGDGTKQYGEGRGYPVMKHGNSGLGRLEKIKKAPV